MNSFLKSIEKRFTLLNESIDLDSNAEEQDVFEEDEELDEISTSAAAGAYLTPKAFSKRGADDDTVEALGYKRVKESVNTRPSYRPGEYQRPESSEEEWNDKFPFSEKKWYNADMKYPSIDMTETPSRTKEEDIPKSKPTRPLADIVCESLDKKYEELIESYKRFATGDSKSTP